MGCAWCFPAARAWWFAWYWCWWAPGASAPAWAELLPGQKIGNLRNFLPGVSVLGGRRAAQSGGALTPRNQKTMKPISQRTLNGIARRALLDVNSTNLSVEVRAEQLDTLATALVSGGALHFSQRLTLEAEATLGEPDCVPFLDAPAVLGAVRVAIAYGDLTGLVGLGYEAQEVLA